MKTKLINYGSIGVFAVVVITMIYFIVHNAQWLIGDDALIIKTIGWGHFFPSSILVIPESGRFAPFVGMHLNILPIISSGYTNPIVVYIYQAFWFLVLTVLSFLLIYNIVKSAMPKAKNWHMPISILGSLMIDCRYYSEFINSFIGSWFWGGVLTMAIMLCAWMFYEKKGHIYAVVAMLLVVYATYCSEFYFAAPLAWGVCALFLWRNSTQAERIFHIGLILNAIVYLSIYGVYILPNVVSSYDSSHGSDVSLLSNAIRIILAQKFVWIIALIFLIRTYEITVKKEAYTIYDVLILAALAHCCAGFILKLNWVLYYNRAIIIALPAVVWYMSRKWHPACLLVLLLCFVGLYGIKIPKLVKENQNSRVGTWTMMSALVEAEEQTQLPVVLYSMADYDHSYNGDLIAWQLSCFGTYYAWAKHNENASLPWADNVEDSGIYVTTSFNEKNIKGANRILKEKGQLIRSFGEIKVYVINE